MCLWFFLQGVVCVFVRVRARACACVCVFSRGKGWKRVLASAHQPPACPFPSTHNSCPQVALRSLDCTFLRLCLCSKGSQILLEPPRMDAISYKPSLLLPARIHLLLPYYLHLLVPFYPSAVDFELLYSCLEPHWTKSPSRFHLACPLPGWALWRATTGGQ